MLRFAGNEVGRLLMGLLGAALMATALGALSELDAGYVSYLSAFADRLSAYVWGDFGISLLTGLPVVAELHSHMPVTLMLTAAGGFLALIVGVPLGLLFQVGAIRRLGAPFVQAISAVPVFCAGLLLAFVAAKLMGWKGDAGIPAVESFFAPGGDALVKAALPVAMVGLAGGAAVQLAMRRAAAAENGSSWHDGLRRLGMSVLEIESIYVLPRILAGLIAHAGDIMLALLSATVVAEWVFFIPGAADMFVKSTALRDWNVVALILFCFAALYFAVDFLGRMAAHIMIREEPAP